MKNGKPLATPVYQKLIHAFGNEYHLEKTEEIIAFYDGITDKSRMKNFD